MLSTKVCRSFCGLSINNKQILKSLINYQNGTHKFGATAVAFMIPPVTLNYNNSVNNPVNIFSVRIIYKEEYLMLKKYYSDMKKEEYQLKVLRSKELLKDAYEKKKEILLEKKNDFVKDIRQTHSRVKERIEKIEGIAERENILTIPNLLCVGRGLLSPYLGYLIIQEQFTLSMGLLVFAGVTDILDGYIARNWPSQASKAGSFLDPMADKLLVGFLVVSLSYTGLLPLWLCGMILFRDVFLIAAGFVIRYISLPPPKTLTRYFDATHVTAQLEPTFISKVNTAVQLIAIATSLGAPIWNYIDHPHLYTLWYVTGFTTAAAAISYIMSKNTFKILNKSKKQ